MIARLRDRIGNRKLVWFGIRGHDAATLLAFEQFQDSFAMTAPIGAASLESDVTLEELTGARVDLDRHDVDLDTREIIAELRRMLMASLNTESVLCTYRAYYFVSNVHFACSETATLLGMFKERQMPFEHKPWVETNLRNEGVRTIPWRYFAEERRQDLAAQLSRGPIVLRASRSSGGTGVALARTPDQIDTRWEPSPDALIAVAPFLEDAAPLNVGACVFSDGTVTVHPASYQLIGVPECTTRDFGYCGNDLALFKTLDARVVDEVDQMTRTVGRWLGLMGYVGAFGIDFLVYKGDVYFSEVNPRFQGSTALTTSACADAGLPDLLLDHMAAYLGENPDPSTAALTLRDWNTIMPDRAQVILHNLANRPVALENPLALIPPRGLRATTQIVPLDGSRVEPGAILCRVVVDDRASDTGYEILSPYQGAVNSMADAFKPIASEGEVAHA
jgi:hypothetical protein